MTLSHWLQERVIWSHSTSIIVPIFWFGRCKFTDISRDFLVLSCIFFPLQVIVRGRLHLNPVQNRLILLCDFVQLSFSQILIEAVAIPHGRRRLEFTCFVLHDLLHLFEQNSILSIDFCVAFFFQLLLFQIPSEMNRTMWFRIVYGRFYRKQFFLMDFLTFLVVFRVCMLVQRGNRPTSTIHSEGEFVL
ncbi:unnamed protein product [Albugo candida]|uniref:Uncharacterized protein n=1 Tax=Albugo candida TaxID=65357 RepID=A0A024G2G9_9STRA|nr:unnamed protein product [Albugo candida]|eukprot:CCI40757.1 unnamed protein product [Albugo candida]